MMDDPADQARLVRAAYDLWAATYDAIDNPLITLAAEVLAGRAAWFDGARVLELGCGTGRNAAFCLAAGASRYVGVDASPGMLDEARRRVSDARASFIEAELEAGAAAARAGGAAFDVCLVCLVFEHIPAVTAGVRAAASALAPGGRLVVLELHPTLHAGGVGANFRVGDEEVRLPSFAHDAEELSCAAAAAELNVAFIVDHVPSAAAMAKSAKLARYAGRPTLLEVVARKQPGAS